MKQSVRISRELSSRILTIGPDYRNHRGGIGAIIDVYSRYFEVFNFIGTHKNGSAFLKITYFLIGLAKLVWLFLSERKIKIVHIHGASYGSFFRKFTLFLLSRYIFRKKIIYHIHGGAYKIFYEKSSAPVKRLIRMFLQKADIVVTLSDSWSDYYRSNFKLKRIIIVPNIIDYPVLDEKTARSGVINLLFLGLICDGKGIFDLIDVIARGKEKYRSRVRLSVAGNGEVNRLKELIKKKSIEDIVDYLGWITTREKETALNRCDIYILPSYNEGLPVSILESMSYGKAIISTNVGGIPEIVKNRKNGLLLEPGNLKQIEDALDYFLVNPGLIKEYGNVSEQMIQRYLPYSVINDLTEIYKSLL